MINKIKSKLLKSYIIIKEKELSNNECNIKYIPIFNKSDDLIIVFSGFSPVGARYNYVKTLFKIKTNKLFILDNFGENNMGSYYLGKNNSFSEEKITIELIEKVKKESNSKRLIFIGSSKGGYAALYFGLKLKVDTIICGAPQYLLGDYLQKTKKINLIRYITGGDSVENIDKLNKILPNKINNVGAYKPKIFIHYSDLEHTYSEHIKFLVDDLKNKHFDITCDVHHYENHSDVAKYFPSFLHQCLKEINKKMILGENF